MQITYLINELFLAYILLKLNSKKANNSVKKWAKGRNRHFTKEGM